MAGLQNGRVKFYSYKSGGIAEKVCVLKVHLE